MKMIEPINPFNEFFYRDCFYNSLFSICRYANGDINRILANDIQLYGHMPGSRLEAGIVTISNEPVKQVLEHLGLGCDCCDQVELNEIFEALDRNMPVIVMVDCFAESIRGDYYQKEHLDHNLLLYGYDLRQRVFYIIEHSGRNRLDYKKKTISFETLLRAAQGYMEYYQKNKQETAVLYKFYRKQAGISQNAAQLFGENYLRHEELLRGQFGWLKRIKERLYGLISDREELAEGIEVIIDEVTAIINAKKADQRKLQLFLNDSEVKRLTESVLSGWIMVRRNLMNFQYNGTEIERKLDEIKLRVDEIVGDEKRLCDLVFFILFHWEICQSGKRP